MGNMPKKRNYNQKVRLNEWNAKILVGGDIPLFLPPWIRHCAHYENYLQTNAKRGEYTITIKKIISTKVC